FTHYWYRHWLPRFGLTIESLTPIGGPGRACAAMCEELYAEGGAAAKTLPALKRAISFAPRGPAVVIVPHVMPHPLPRFDRWLGAQTVCSGYLVVATKA